MGHEWVQPGVEVVVVSYRGPDTHPHQIITAALEKITTPSASWDVPRAHVAVPAGTLVFNLNRPELREWLDDDRSDLRQQFVRLYPVDHPDLPALRRSVEALPLVTEAEEAVTRYRVADSNPAYLLDAARLLEKAHGVIVGEAA